MGIGGKLHKRLVEGKTEVGSTKSEAGSRKYEVGSTKLEVRSTKLEVGSTKLEVGSTKSEVGSTKYAGAGGPWSVVRGLSLLTTIVLLLSASALHPYYMSVTEFEYKAVEKEVQVSCKIFTDDLEEALKETVKRNVDILSTSAKKENEQLLNTYLQQHLKLQLDGKTVALQMIGFEQEGEAVWIYLVTKNTAAFKTATVFNDLLYSYKAEQINIIHFKNRNERKSHRLNYPDKQVTLSW